MYISTLAVPYADANATSISNINEYSSVGFTTYNTYFVRIDKYSKIAYFGKDPNDYHNNGFIYMSQ